MLLHVRESHISSISDNVAQIMPAACSQLYIQHDSLQEERFMPTQELASMCAKSLHDWATSLEGGGFSREQTGEQT